MTVTNKTDSLTSYVKERDAAEYAEHLAAAAVAAAEAAAEQDLKDRQERLADGIRATLADDPGTADAMIALRGAIEHELSRYTDRLDHRDAEVRAAASAAAELGMTNGADFPVYTRNTDAGATIVIDGYALRASVARSWLKDCERVWRSAVSDLRRVRQAEK